MLFILLSAKYDYRKPELLYSPKKRVLFAYSGFKIVGKTVIGGIFLSTIGSKLNFKGEAC